MDSLQVPRPTWMSEDLNLLEEQTRKFLAGELCRNFLLGSGDR